MLDDPQDEPQCILSDFSFQDLEGDGINEQNFACHLAVTNILLCQKAGEANCTLA